MLAKRTTLVDTFEILIYTFVLYDVVVIYGNCKVVWS